MSSHTDTDDPEGVLASPAISQDEAMAYVLAKHAHGYQRYGNEPYTVHLQEVRDILVDHRHEYLAPAGWLHDILEDTKVTEEELRMCFDDFIVDAVVAVTGTGQGRKAKLESVIPKLEVCKYGRVLKLADRLANVRSCIRGMQSSQSDDEEAAAWEGPARGLGPGREILSKSREDYQGLFFMYLSEWSSIRPHLLNAHDVMVAELDALLDLRQPA